jgi:2,3-bisphosphoglycerate-independent phosphoglycerate mutase
MLIIRDGWGYRAAHERNAIAEAGTPVTDRLMKRYPTTLLAASGEAVGLPAGYQGNSEVGHMTIGSGRVIPESFERINRAIRDKSFFRIPELVGVVEHCRKQGTTLHLIGLLQTEAVHAHISHLFALLDLCKQHKLKRVLVHVITDGRDAPVVESERHVADLQKKLDALGFGTIATVTGRYFAMDRDRRWKRTKRAYDCIVNGVCHGQFTVALDQIRQCHKAGETDEFMLPRKKRGYDGIKRNDGVIFYNFRTDRPRQLTKAIVEPEFEGWKRKPLDVSYVGMTQYYEPMNAAVAFKDIVMVNGLGEVVSKAGLRQFRTAETEKYAHVTFFFNGQVEIPNPGEDRLLIHSPKVPTYDLKPEMSAEDVTRHVVERIKLGIYDFIVLNFANPDMVGHTGKMAAIREAVRVVDACTGKILDAALPKGYTVFIFGDHGNAEDKTPAWATSHTINPVPFILVSPDKKLLKVTLRKNGGLSDVAPTVLALMGIPKPKEMTGRTLIVGKK